MAFRGSLNFIRPGRAVLLSVEELRRFTETLRLQLGLRDVNTRVWLRRGTASEPAFDASHGLVWNAAGTLESLPPGYWRRFQPMDHTASDQNWEALWPKPSLWSRLGWQREEKAVHAASMNIGSLTREASLELGAKDPTAAESYFAPETALFTVGPCSPYTLATNAPLDDEASDHCHGCLALGLSGNGYFSWQPLDRYWAGVREAKLVVAALRICREHLPASPELTAEAIVAALGNEPFLNRAEYAPGDWVVSIKETG